MECLDIPWKIERFCLHYLRGHVLILEPQVTGKRVSVCNMDDNGYCRRNVAPVSEPVWAERPPSPERE